MKRLFNLHEQPSVAKSMLVPEVERLSIAVSSLAGMLNNPAVKLEEISKTAKMSLTELRFQGWEQLFNYIRDLESKVSSLTAELDVQHKQMRELVIFVEETSQKIVKLYREHSLRSPNE